MDMDDSSDESEYEEPNYEEEALLAAYSDLRKSQKGYVGVSDWFKYSLARVKLIGQSGCFFSWYYQVHIPHWFHVSPALDCWLRTEDEFCCRP